MAVAKTGASDEYILEVLVSGNEAEGEQKDGVPSLCSLRAPR